MVLDKYITIAENGIAGQDARTKEWYCKELPFKDDKDLKIKAGKVNAVLNELNKNYHKEGDASSPSTPHKKERK